MTKVSVEAYPYAYQYGEIEIPDYIEEDDYRNYIVKNWNNIEFGEVSLDYCGTDFDYEKTESN